MPRPVKWSRDLYSIRERAASSRTETWSRRDIELLFHLGPASAQNLMKAIGDVQPVGAAHFVERTTLLAFLDEMIDAPSVEAGLKLRHQRAQPVPRPRPLRVSLPSDLRHAMMPDLPSNIVLEPGRLEIRAASCEAMLESLVTLAMVMQNDLERFRELIEPPKSDSELRQWLRNFRETHRYP